MDFVRILGVVIMFGILIFAVIKKYQPTITLIILGVIAIAICNLAAGTMPMGDQTSGNFVVDLFEFIRSRFVSQLGGTALIVMSAIAFVSYMDHLKATKMFAAIVSRPLRHVKSPYVVVAASLVLMAVMDLFVASASGRAALYLATIYPILIAANVTVATAAVTVVLAANYVCVGPTASLVITALGLGEAGVDSTQQFLFFDIKVQIIVMLVIIPVFCIVQRHFDNRDKAKGLIDESKDQELLDIKSLGIPKWFAILPTIPLILCVLFSSLVISSVTISVPAAMFIGWFFAFFCNLIFTKGKKKELFNDGQVYLTSLGKALGYTGALLICANIFSAGITQIGGLEVIIDSLTGGTGTGAAVIIAGALVTVMYAISIAVTGSANANIAVFATMLAGMAKGPQYSQLLSMLVPGGCLGAVLSPISGVTIIVSGNTGLEITRILKRTAIPAVAGILTAILASAIVL